MPTATAADPQVEDPQSRLQRFLAHRFPDSEVSVTDCAPLTGGYSCRLTRFVATIDGEERRLVARADPPPGEAFLMTDRDKEWAVLEALTEHGRVPMPNARFYDADGSELGAKTMIVDYVDGESLIERIRSTPDEELEAQADALADLIATIHAVDLGVLPDAIGRPRSWDDWFEASVSAWRQVEAEHGQSLPAVRYLAAWLEQHRPPPAPLTLLHGDFQTPNVMVQPDGSLVAIDWELARVGDPREDLGWFEMVHALQPPDLIGRDELRFCERYRARTGLGADLINPLALAYFTILPGAPLLGMLLTQVRLLEEGARVPVLSAYQVEIVAAVLQLWVQTARRLSEPLQDGWEAAT